MTGGGEATVRAPPPPPSPQISLDYLASPPRCHQAATPPPPPLPSTSFPPCRFHWTIWLALGFSLPLPPLLPPLQVSLDHLASPGPHPASPPPSSPCRFHWTIWLALGLTLPLPPPHTHFFSPCRFHWTIWLALGLTLICTPMLIWLVENLVLVSGESGVGERRTGCW